MANDEMMVSKRPSAGSGSDKSCWTSSTRSSPTKRLRAVEHDLGEVEAHTMHLRMACLEHGEQTPIARTEVEDPANIPGHLFEQDALPFGPVRELVRPAQVASHAVAVGPLLAGHAVSMQWSVRVSLVAGVPSAPTAAHPWPWSALARADLRTRASTAGCFAATGLPRPRRSWRGACRAPCVRR